MREPYPSRKVTDRAKSLTGTSVQDMQSSLYNYSYKDGEDIAVIRHAIGLTQKRGEKTKTQVLQRKLRKMYKELQDANEGVKS